MAPQFSGHKIDPRSGYCAATKTYHSLRPPISIPPASTPLSISDYAFSVCRSSAAASSLDNAVAFVDAAADISISYFKFFCLFQSLCSSLQSTQINPPLSKGHVALIVSPASLRLPVLYFSLASLGVIVSPANPLSSESELSHIVRLAKPTIAFAASAFAHKIPSYLPVVILDSPEFDSFLNWPAQRAVETVVEQSDTAAILYSSGTTGRVKGVELSHSNLISVVATSYPSRRMGEEVRKRTLFTVPLFHVFGLFMMFNAVVRADTVVLMGGGERFDFEGMLRAVERYRVTNMPVSPPLVLAMVKSELTLRYDLSSLEVLSCGGAPLGDDLARRFKKKFPAMEIARGYGLTETAGGIARTIEADEIDQYGSVGRLGELVEAKIVDPTTGEALPPGQRGELWLRGPAIMKGYVGDKEATSSTLNPDGWLKTGDLCYFDSDGFLYIVDRLKELIKYKAYQVPPAELEHMLLSHPEIADAAVIGYSDEEAGEVPLAFVVRKPGSSISGVQIMDFVSKQVAPYKKIRRVFFTQAIPKSSAGKILRRELKNQAVLATSAKL